MVRKFVLSTQEILIMLTTTGEFHLEEKKTVLGGNSEEHRTSVLNFSFVYEFFNLYINGNTGSLK